MSTKFLAHYRKPLTREDGAAVIEMALMLPLLVMLMIGVWTFMLYISQRQAMSRAANQISAVLATISLADLKGDSKAIIDQTMAEAQSMILPYNNANVQILFCEKYQGSWYAIYDQTAGPACGTVHDCETDSATARGYDAFVQSKVCVPFKQPLAKTYFFDSTSEIETVSYQPLIERNQTQLLLQLGLGTRRPAGSGSGSVTPPTPTCGTPGLPTCTVTAPTPTCGTTGLPACTPTPTGTPACTPPYQAGTGGTACYIVPQCFPSDPSCVTPCTGGGTFDPVKNVCTKPINCGPGEVVDATTGKCTNSCPPASLCTSGQRDMSNCSCVPQVTCTPPEVVIKNSCYTPCPYGTTRKQTTACEPECNSGIFYKGGCPTACPPGYKSDGISCNLVCDTSIEVPNPITGGCDKI